MVTEEEAFDAISRHPANVGQAGRDMTWAEVRGIYSGVKHGAIDWVPKHLHQLQLSAVTQSFPSG